MASTTPEQFQKLVAQLNEVAKAYSDSPDVNGTKSRVAITDKAKSIVQAMMDPSDMGMHHLVNMTELVALRTLLKFKVLETIPHNGSISLEALTKATGVQDQLLDRMLRLVVGTGFLDQTPGGEYIHTKFSTAYITVPGPGKFFQAMYDNYLKAMVDFDDYLIMRNSLTEPDDFTKCPYTYYLKQDGKSTWEVMAQDPERIETFQLGFAGMEEASAPIVGYYDFSKLATNEEGRVALVDVGGGQGHSLKQIMDAHPELSPSRVVLQDLPDPIAIAKESGFLPAETVKMVHDFYTEQPVKGARGYYLRRIIHDYSDANDITILKHLAQAMKPDSVVLIADFVIPARVGEADLGAAAMDNTVMAMGGKERTEVMFEDILSKSGLELVKVWRSGVGVQALVEARLKQ